MSHRNNIVPAAPVPVRSNRQKYHAGMPQRVIDMARDGMFPEEWCAELGISMRTLYAWANDRPEFEEAVEDAWHALHAYWARLMRENITNPAFRQTAALQIIAKRFPATWGQHPRNTLDHFQDRNAKVIDTPEGACPNCTHLRNMSDEELTARRQELESRLRAREE